MLLLNSNFHKKNGNYIFMTEFNINRSQIKHDDCHYYALNFKYGIKVKFKRYVSYVIGNIKYIELCVGIYILLVISQH